ncbi:MAG: RdgB/HAM1 family non-canonical purine NTP pyrophosphatase [Proteobacteria bacterium]|nr:RdgB/HAM1 family non-canonical purine NTP pyrophosphatase [Pseudomonadota bacterium]
MARRLAGRRLVIATHNRGKLAEIAALLAPLAIAVVAAGDLGLPEPAETGRTFAENARLKALAAARGARLPALADDSGLEVAALAGRPGIESARWAGPARDFAAAMRRVEEALRALAPALDRRARFVCALALAWPDGHVEPFEGRIEGRVVWPPRGGRGFGYDPIFVPEGYEETFGEMDPAMKHAISHRAAAFRKLISACLAGEGA